MQTETLKPVQSNSVTTFLWTLPQPIVVFGAMLLVASANVAGWTDADQLTTILLLCPIPMLLIAGAVYSLLRWLLDRKFWPRLARSRDNVVVTG